MDEEGISVAYQGFLVQGTVQMNNLLQWNRRWCVLPADDHVLKAYSMRSATTQKPLWELDLTGCQVAPVDPREAGDKTSAFRILPPPDSNQPVYLLRTYEESEMRKCMKALAAATGEPHSESQLTEFLVVPGRGVSASPIPPRGASAASQTAILPSGEVFEIDDGDGLYSVPPPSKALAEDTYDVPPSRPSGGPSRSTSDFDFPTEEQLRDTPPNAGAIADDNEADELEQDPNYSELNFRSKPPPHLSEERTSVLPPVLPERTSGMLITSMSDATDHRPSATFSEDMARGAKESYANNGEGVYESLPVSL